MTRSFDKSKAIYEEAVNLMPGGVNSPVRAFKAVNQAPIVMDHGKGAIITDVDGNDYIDYVLSWGPLILGHTEPNVIKAIQDVAMQGTSFGASTAVENELAKEGYDELEEIEKELANMDSLEEVEGDVTEETIKKNSDEVK